MVKLKSKNMYFVIILLIFVIAIFSIFLIKANENNHHKKNSTAKPIGLFDTNFDTNAKYIDFNSSKNFIYDIKITIDNSKPTNNMIQLTYEVGITPKNKKVVYQNVIATASLDKSMMNYIVSNNFLFFGTDMSKPITIDNKKNTGIDISYSPFIKKDYNKNQLINYLKLPLLLKISWKDNVEYVKMMPSESNIKFK